MPERIQRKRKKGWRMPANTVYVGRPTKWGNPFIVGREYRDLFGAAKLCTKVLARDWFKAWINDTKWSGAGQLLERANIELRGKNLACWCPMDQPCHADVLLELANGQDRKQNNSGNDTES